jgi:hypothetical protein
MSGAREEIGALAPPAPALSLSQASALAQLLASARETRRITGLTLLQALLVRPTRVHETTMQRLVELGLLVPAKKTGWRFTERGLDVALSANPAAEAAAAPAIVIGGEIRVVIEGDSGAGKTRLLDAIGNVLQGAGYHVLERDDDAVTPAAWSQIVEGARREARDLMQPLAVVVTKQVRRVAA